jgi:DNA-binding MarR family transcriptional regulator
VREEALLSARLNDLHMIVLGTIAHFAGADVEDIADWLGVPVAVAEALCADLEDAGLVTSAREASSRPPRCGEQDRPHE